MHRQFGPKRYDVQEPQDLPQFFDHCYYIDETCAALVHQHGVAQSLLDLLRLEIDRLKASGVREETKSTIKVLHAVVGALKNLSLAGIFRTNQKVLRNTFC